MEKEIECEQFTPLLFPNFHLHVHVHFGELTVIYKRERGRMRNMSKQNLLLALVPKGQRKTVFEVSPKI